MSRNVVFVFSVIVCHGSAVYVRDLPLSVHCSDDLIALLLTPAR